MIEKKGEVITISGFELWRGVLGASTPGSDMEKKAKAKLLECAKTSSEWYSLHFCFSSNAPEYTYTLDKMAETAITGTDWDNVYLCAADDSELKLLAYHKMAELNSHYFNVLNNNMDKKPSTFFRE